MEIIVVEQIRDIPIKEMHGYRVDAKHTLEDRASQFESIYGYYPDVAWKWDTYVYFKEKAKKLK